MASTCAHNWLSKCKGSVQTLLRLYVFNDKPIIGSGRGKTIKIYFCLVLVGKSFLLAWKCLVLRGPSCYRTNELLRNKQHKKINYIIVLWIFITLLHVIRVASWILAFLYAHHSDAKIAARSAVPGKYEKAAAKVFAFDPGWVGAFFFVRSVGLR